MFNTLKAEQDFQEIMVTIGLQMGANMLLAKVNAVLFLEPRPISLEEIAERTGYSLPSVSSAVKMLEAAGKIIRHKEKGNKKVFVSFQHDMIRTMRDQFMRGHQVVIKPLQQQIPLTIAELKKELKRKHSAEKKKQIKEKIDWYECYLKQLEELENIFAKITALFKEVNHHHK